MATQEKVRQGMHIPGTEPEPRQVPALQRNWQLPPGAGHETASSAQAAQARAEIEARTMMAMRNTRDDDDVRVRILNECRRPSFARNPSAYYHKPVGKGVEGLGIRFVEMALRQMGNISTQVRAIYEDSEKRVLNVSVVDLERNTGFDKDVTVMKTVERSKPLDDGTYLSMRTNSQGKPSYTVVANDDDMLNKEGSLVSKAIRTNGERLIPGDWKDEAIEIILQIRADDAAKDPEGEKKKLIDGFFTLNIGPAHVAEYLGHGLNTVTPAELVQLRGLYGALRDGEATWATVMENKRAEDAEKNKKTAGLSDKIGKGRAGKKDKKDAKDAGDPKGSDPGVPPNNEPPAPGGPSSPPSNLDLITMVDDIIDRTGKAALPQMQDLINEIEKITDVGQRKRAATFWNERLKLLRPAETSVAPRDGK